MASKVETVLELLTIMSNLCVSWRMSLHLSIAYVVWFSLYLLKLIYYLRNGVLMESAKASTVYLSSRMLWTSYGSATRVMKVFVFLNFTAQFQTLDWLSSLPLWVLSSYLTFSTLIYYIFWTVDWMLHRWMGHWNSLQHPVHSRRIWTGVQRASGQLGEIRGAHKSPRDFTKASDVPSW